MSIGIIILNYNGSAETVECINSILVHNSAPVKFIIVDNGSTQPNQIEIINRFLSTTFGEDYHIIQEHDEGARLLKANLIISQTNDGYAIGNNKGLKFAFQDDDIRDILILNNDILFLTDIITALLYARKELDHPAILTPVIFNKTGRIEYSCARSVPTNWQIIAPFAFFNRDCFHILSRAYGKECVLTRQPELLNGDAFEIGMPSGSFMFIDKQLFKTLGGFEKGTFLYYEENILCSILSKRGLRNYCIPTCTALHTGGASTRKTLPSFLMKCKIESADYYMKGFTDFRPCERLVWAITKQAWKPYLKLKQIKESR
jgi:GT2 family glycosyltransferase